MHVSSPLKEREGRRKGERERVREGRWRGREGDKCKKGGMGREREGERKGGREGDRRMKEGMEEGVERGSEVGREGVKGNFKRLNG